MSFKDLLVHVGTSRHQDQALDVAVRLARDFAAHLTGLYTTAEIYVPPYLEERFAADIITEQRKHLAASRRTAKARFEDRARKAAVEAEWRESEGDAPKLVRLHARYADLTVLGQSNPNETLPFSESGVPERVLLESGRPVLLVPYAGMFSTTGQRALVAWNASAQATRAVNDALPLLRRAKSVTILAVNPERGNGGHGQIPGADISLHLARHGVATEASHAYADDMDVGDVILSRAADLSADLIVMGAYGRTRLRETVLGGATRSLLRQMTAPLFMSH